MTIDMDRVIEACETDEDVGFCVICGVEHDGIEPDAKRYTCEACGCETVYGREEILLKYP